MKKRSIIISIGVLIVLLIAFRLYLPTLVLNFVNNKINEIPDYSGHVKDIDLSLWRGAYQIEGIELKKMSGKIPEPFFEAREIDLSVQWKALFKGSLVGEMVFFNPTLNFVEGPSKEQSQTEVDSSWIDVVKDLMPIEINYVQVVNGEIKYKDHHSSPKVNMKLSNVNGIARNLKNTDKNDKLLPSSVDVTANAYKGNVKLEMELDPLQEKPTFDLNCEAKNIDLVQLNDFLKAYAKFDVHQGTFGLYTELAAKDGKFTGYMKPTFDNLKIFEWKKEEEGILKKAWEATVSVVAEVLENQKEDRVATKIPLSGSFENPKPDIMTTVWGVLKNAFIEALSPSIEGSVNIQDIGGADSGQKSKKKDN